MNSRDGADGRPSAVERLRQERQALADTGALLPNTDLGRWAGQFGQAHDWPEQLADTPVIIDTDIGCDPDDALAVAAAARMVPQLALVITADETGPSYGAGQRARLARWLLTAAGRRDVTVVEGLAPHDSPYYCMDGLIPEHATRQPGGIAEAVRAVAAATDGPIRWLGLGPMGNLAHVVAKAPELVPLLRVTQMGGGLGSRHGDLAEHNLRVNAPAARGVLVAVADHRLSTPEFVTTDVTWTDATAITADSPLYTSLKNPAAPEWARILGMNLDRFFERFHPATMQHDPMALSAALNLPFVTSRRLNITLDESGRMSATDEGPMVRVSSSARYEPFMAWLTAALDPAAAVSSLVQDKAVSHEQQ